MTSPVINLLVINFLVILSGAAIGVWLARHPRLQSPLPRAALLASFPLYHVLFALLAFHGTSEITRLQQDLLHELVAMAGFWLLAWESLRHRAVLPAALLAHGLYDGLLASAAAPWWWAGFCGAVDITLALLWWAQATRRHLLDG
ncbi:hypothetical protein KJI95_10640 [Shewanella sp. JM162201]|uniref:Uncharacterized protein n=1 Tax=Shewanella jiangmenensis TaxID=2837387 RepID=A0ABS5V3F8_9GAMM|nr:hypothetical protein [Shewanella jiangmenensis]MBT1444981.1 hypothetical protein [Shewanella jiangmenensis]